ncbi:MAG: HDIG domain-containing metalloprotein, partial [Nitrospinota bacterium]
MSQRIFRKVMPQRLAVGGRFFPWVMGAALSLFLAAVTTTGFYSGAPAYRAGDIARRDIKAPQDMLVPDPAATEALRQEARERVLPHYDLDPQLAEEIQGKVRSAFDAIQRTLRAQTDATRDALLAGRGAEVISEARVLEETRRSPAFLAAAEAFERHLDGAVAPALAEWMRGEGYAGWIRDDLTALIGAALAAAIVSDRQLYAAHAAKGVAVRDIRSGRRVSLDRSVHPIELRGVEEFLRRRAAQPGLQAPPPRREALVGLAAKLVRPTLTFNGRATVEAQQEEAAKAEPVSQLLKEGEMIVREGERLTEAHLLRLRSLDRQDRQRHVLDNMLGTAAVTFILLSLSWVCAQRYLLSILGGPKSLTLFVILLASQALLLKLGIVVAHSFQDAYRGVAIQSFYFIIPFASAPMLAALLQGRSAAVLMAVMSAGLTAMIIPVNVQYSLVALAGGIYSAIRWKNYRHRSSILVACAAVGLLSAALAAGFSMQEGLTFAMQHWHNAPLAFLGGLANVIVVSAAMPLLESIFKQTTDMRLLELTDQNHPVLRQLVVRAPGTYHHSLIVGNLAEEAAEAIHAHPLLVRVGAYFHDIGKIFKSEYFVENQGR